jgi:hypothetical protein
MNEDQKLKVYRVIDNSTYRSEKELYLLHTPKFWAT